MFTLMFLYSITEVEPHQEPNTNVHYCSTLSSENISVEPFITYYETESSE